MKKIFLLSCLLIWPLSVSATPSHTAFDDDNFYNCVVEKYKSDHPLEGITDILTDVQLQAITELMCISKNISSVKGIEKLTNLKSLSLGDNNISSIDLKSNSQLSRLSLSNNNINNIDLSNNKNVQYLNLEANDLKEINIDYNEALLELNIAHNSLSNLNLTNNQELTSLYVSYNKITNIDLKNNSKLKIVNLDNNNITNINFSNNPNLEQIDLSNNSLRIINLNLAKLKKIKVVNNYLTNMNINCPELEMLDISNNQILAFDLSNLNNIKNSSPFEHGNSEFELGSPTTITPQAKTLTVYNGKLDLKEYDSNFNPSKVEFTPIDGVTYDSKTGIFTFTKEVEKISYIYKTGLPSSSGISENMTVNLTLNYSNEELAPGTNNPTNSETNPENTEMEENNDPNLPENPSTGVFLPIVSLVILTIGGISIYFYTKKKRKMLKL